jgi:hypothetical protein
VTTGEIRFIDYGPVVDHGNVDAIRDLEKWIGGKWEENIWFGRLMW